MSAKSSKPKSPPTPSRALGDAVADVKKVYNEYSHGTFARAEIASALGISATSGPFAARLFTLKAFGLIDQSGMDFKVTETFITLNSAQPGDIEFKRAAVAAIRGSDTFRELLEDFNTKLPSVDAVAGRLETQKRFNAARAKAAANVLEKSLRFAGVLDAANSILPIRDSKPNGSTGTREIADDREEDRIDAGHSRDDDASADTLSLEIPVGEGRRVLVRYPSDLSAAEATKVGNVLKAVVA